MYKAVQSQEREFNINISVQTEQSYYSFNW